MSDVFVFGSNLQGIHGAGAALDARMFYGAKRGLGEGFAGSCYAIPTKVSPYLAMSSAEVHDHVKRFLNHASLHHADTFRLTRIGCGLAGFRDEQIAPMFFDAPDNVILPGLWQRLKDETTVRLVIAGSREITSREYVFAELGRLTKNLLDENLVTVVCGMARGVDTLGREWSESMGFPIDLFPANWELYGKAAGMLRNKLMANHGTHLIALWDGKSSGTKQMIDVAKSFGLQYRVVCKPNNTENRGADD